MFGKRGLVVILGLSFLLSGCAYHTTAKNWNGVMAADGKPAYYKQTSKVALNLLILVPFIGNVSVDGMVEDLTEDIAKEKGDHVRIVQGSSENYWYGFPPFTWILTPVITTVSAEYTPESTGFEKDQKKIQEEKKNSSGMNPTEW